MRPRNLLLSLLIMVMAPAICLSYCFEEAGKKYGVSPVVLQAISKVESNYKVDAINKNKNESRDFGHMQINDRTWKKYLGDGWEYLIYDPCYCTQVGAWILRQCMNRYGNTWDAIACYHCGKSPEELPLKTRMRAYEYIRKVQEQIYK
ncbi:MAG: lytic transglycosylase domain-containing protein [Proteobacteria bacterium]|nr:lytic transglycosylase domain-containing protein [Pseudomonadota bacterium]